MNGKKSGAQMLCDTQCAWNCAGLIILVPQLESAMHHIEMFLIYQLALLAMHNSIENIDIL